MLSSRPDDQRDEGRRGHASSSSETSEALKDSRIYTKFYADIDRFGHASINVLHVVAIASCDLSDAHCLVARLTFWPDQ